MLLRRKINKSRKRKSGGSRKTRTSSRTRKAVKTIQNKVRSRQRAKTKAATKVQNKVRSRQRAKTKAATKVQSLARMLRGQKLAREERDIDEEIAFIRSGLSKPKYNYPSSSDDSEEDEEIKWIRRAR